ncbi:uncharacterized protein LOC117331620 isoform X1 [Pecten maximus]|uniref:uncharacterized protein LOC117331620 isoform X1 n=1 Tax=Pecten maximus TaxID=6579 RepID=UPI001457FB54|nr:uncharacterized protein LOC117331620 isoform X1 [Pecten maximus]
MAEGSTRFAEATEDEIQKTLNDRDSKNTKNVIRTAENLLHEYCEAVGCTVGSPLTNVTVYELCEILRKFYCATRKKDGNGISLCGETAEPNLLKIDDALVHV